MSYKRQQPPTIFDADWLGKELDKVEQAFAFSNFSHYKETFVEPAKPRTGQVYLADGALWNPGGGRGLYVFLDTFWSLIPIALSANRTYYVRTDGNDSNSGLVDSAGGAFATIQKAINTVSALNLLSYNVTIRVGNGTYAPFEVARGWLGGGRVTVLGNVSSPSSCVIAETVQDVDAVFVFNYAQLDIGGFKITTANTHGIHAADYSTIDFVGNMEFGACAGSHVRAENQAIIRSEENAIAITGGAERFFRVDAGGVVKFFDSTFTLTGTPNFSAEFAQVSTLGTIIAPGNSFTGAATGKRYTVDYNSIVQVAGAGVNYFPGNVAGTVATGGQYA